MILAAIVGLTVGDWTCDNCERAGAELSNILTSEAGLVIQENLILTQYCPEKKTPQENCEAFVPDFWKAIALQLWPEAWSSLCVDIECVAGDSDLTCDECQTRLELALEMIRDPSITEWWVNKLSESSFCADNYSGVEDVCQAHLKDVFPGVLMVMTQNDWVPSFCSDFGCM